MMAHCKNVDEFQRVLECPICLERIRDPRILSCLHSFCFKCIEQHVEEKQTNDSFPCPMCNLEFPVPPGGAAEFKSNLYLVNIGELFPELSDLKCALCSLKGSNSDVDSMCIQCREYLCQECRQSHCLSTCTFNHTVVSLDEIRNGQHFEEVRQFKKFYCSKHPQKLLEIYCIDCMKPLCLLCAMLDHKQHDMKNVEEAAAENCDVLRRLLGVWKMASEHYAKLSSERKTVLENLGEDEERMVREIHQVYESFKDEIIVEIDLKMNESIESLKVEVGTARKQADAAYNEAELSRISTSGTLKYVEDLLDSGNDIEKLQQFHELKTRLSKLDIGDLETIVTRPVLKLLSDNLTISDLSVPTVATFEENRIFSTAAESLRHPTLKENALQTGCRTTRCPKEEESCCSGVVVSGNTIIITDYGNKNVKLFDINGGNYLLEVKQDQHKLQDPNDAACNSSGEIFVTDDGEKCIVKYNEKGEVIKVSASKMYAEDAHVTCHGNQLFLSDYEGGRIVVMDFDLNVGKVIDGGSRGPDEMKPDYVCTNNEGHLVVSDYGNGRVLVIDHEQSKVISTFSEYLGECPRGVCVDEWGHIFVADKSNNQVVLIPDQCRECTEMGDGNPEAADKQLNHARVLLTSDDVSDPISLAITGRGEIAVLEEISGKLKIFQYMCV